MTAAGCATEPTSTDPRTTESANTPATTATAVTTTEPSTTASTTPEDTVAAIPLPNVPIASADQLLSFGDCYTRAGDTVMLIDCDAIHDGQVFDVDVPLNGVAPDEMNVDVWVYVATSTCAPAFTEFTGKNLGDNRFTIVAVLTAVEATPVVACAAIAADGSQWAGTAELIVGAFEGIGVGDCFDFPTTTSHADKLTCEEPHEAEMFVVDEPIGIDEPAAEYPTSVEWEEIAARLCDQAFVAYTGQPLEIEVLSYTYIYTLEPEWSDVSQRLVSCAVNNFDGTRLVGAVRP